MSACERAVRESTLTARLTVTGRQNIGLSTTYTSYLDWIRDHPTLVGYCHHSPDGFLLIRGHLRPLLLLYA